MSEEDISHLDTYIEKQEKFRKLVKEIQKSIDEKDYVKEGATYDEYIRKKWNISKAQSYRFLIAAKVLDQLEEFKIQPNYERICRTLYTYAKTPQQMKLLWKTVLQKSNNQPDSINSSHITKVWKELCLDKRYSHICHYEDDIISKVEQSLNDYTRKKKIRQLNSVLVNNYVSYGNNTNNNTNPMFMYNNNENIVVLENSENNNNKGFVYNSNTNNGYTVSPSGMPEFNPITNSEFIPVSAITTINSNAIPVSIASTSTPMNNTSNVVLSNPVTPQTSMTSASTSNTLINISPSSSLSSLNSFSSPSSINIINNISPNSDSTLSNTTSFSSPLYISQSSNMPYQGQVIATSANVVQNQPIKSPSPTMIQYQVSASSSNVVKESQINKSKVIYYHRKSIDTPPSIIQGQPPVHPINTSPSIIQRQPQVYSINSSSSMIQGQTTPVTPSVIPGQTTPVNPNLIQSQTTSVAPVYFQGQCPPMAIPPQGIPYQDQSVKVATTLPSNNEQQTVVYQNSNTVNPPQQIIYYYNQKEQ